MSSPTHELSQAHLTITSADSGNQATSRPSFRPARTRTRHSTAASTDQRPSLLLLIPLLGAAACAVLIGGLVIIARHSVPTPIQQEVILWEQDCLQGTASTSSFQALASSVAYPGTAPGGLAGIRTVGKLVTFGKLTLADLILALGEPDRVGCVDFGLIPGPTPVRWTRLVMDDGQVEAYAVLPYNVDRLSPDTAVHTLRCYGPDTSYPLRHTGSWRGFTAFTAFPACPPSGTATPR